MAPPNLPNRMSIVQRVNSQHPELLQSNTHENCTKLLQHFILECQTEFNERWDHLSKKPDENGYTIPGTPTSSEFPNGVRVAIDVVVHHETQWLVDIIGGSGNPPHPGSPAWIELGPQGVDRPWNRAIPLCEAGVNDISCVLRIVEQGGGGEPVPVQGIPWIITCFPLLAGEKKFAEQLEASLLWEAQTGFNDGVRAFGHCMGGPWEEQLPDGRPGAAINMHWPDYVDVLKRAEDRLRKHQMTANMFTFFGGPVPLNEGQWFIELMGQHIDRSLWRWYEICNEWKVNGWDAATVKSLTERFNQVFGSSALIATSSPHLAHNDLPNGGTPTDADMKASYNEIYSGVHTSWATIHPSRDPNSKWCDPRSFLILGKVFGITEPRGPGASAGGDVSDPNVIRGDYVNSGLAGCLTYCKHYRQGVFYGHLDRAKYPQYVEDYPWQHAGMDEINAALRAERNRSGSSGGGGSPVPVEKIIAMRSDHQLLLCSEQPPWNLVANRDYPLTDAGPWEQFRFIPLGGDQYAVEDHHKRLLTAEPDLRVYMLDVGSREPRVQAYEVWTVVRDPLGRPGYIALKSHHGTYMGAWGMSNLPPNVTPGMVYLIDHLEGWETWAVHPSL